MAQPLPAPFPQSTPAFSLDPRTSLQDLEDKIKYEMEQKYQQRIQDLERRSLYLDRSLDLIEEMRQKFEAYESQQQDYNALLVKYNSLVTSNPNASQGISLGVSQYVS